MKCRLCRRPCDPDRMEGHHDHLGRAALKFWRRMDGGATKDGDGHVAALVRSLRFQRLLRFRGRVECCQGCNGLECAWKIGSNLAGGFLPSDFTLTPREIGRIRRADLDNGDPRVDVRIKAIWERRRLGHARRLAMVERMVRARHGQVAHRRRP